MEVGVRRVALIGNRSLILDAIRIGLQASGDFTLLDHDGGADRNAGSVVALGPDVVLVDDCDSSEVATGIVRDVRLLAETVTIIVLTCSMDAGSLDVLFNAGAAAAISKMTQPQSLSTLIRATLDGHVVNLPAAVVTSRSLSRAAQVEPRDGRAHAELTSRELEILQLVAGGSSNQEIARNLWVTEQTVKFHLAHVYRKLGIDNRTQASRYAHVNGLMPSGPVATGN